MTRRKFEMALKEEQIRTEKGKLIEAEKGLIGLEGIGCDE
jgi:hypothetical protein